MSLRRELVWGDACSGSAKSYRLLEMLFEIRVSRSTSCRSTSCRSVLRTADWLKRADAQVRQLEKHVNGLFTFLSYPGADATNWRGEQAIRPAVVNRKVWGGHRTKTGALAHSRIISVTQTCKQRLADPFDFIHRQLVSTVPLALPLPVTAR